MGKLRVGKFNKHGWMVTHNETYTSANICPVKDLIDHEESEDCICGPALQLVPTDHGDAWLVRHHALDGRK